MERAWYILRVRSGNEVSAARESGYYAYVPHIQHRYYDRRRRVTIARRNVMLPGYVFILCRHPRDIVFRPQPGVIGFMRNGDYSFATLTDRAFAELMDVENTYELPGPPQAWKPKKGERVEVALRSGNIPALVQEIRGDTAVLAVKDSSIRFVADIARMRAA